jgi:hypothetical protein
MNERTKKQLRILLFALASGFLLYNGFSMLIEASHKEASDVQMK